MPAPRSPCPSAEDLARLAHGDGPPALLDGWRAHVAGCPLCRAIAHGLGGGPGRPPAPPDVPTPAAPHGHAPRSLWWVPWLTHAVIALLVGVLGWWFLGR